MNRKTEIQDSLGKRKPALDVFTHSIGKLRSKLLETLQRSSGKHGVVAEADIFWVITVPAIWGDAAKQFMREAAVGVSTVKHVSFARTLFSRKFGRAKRRENKVLANNYICIYFTRSYDKREYKVSQIY